MGGASSGISSPRWKLMPKLIVAESTMRGLHAVEQLRVGAVLDAEALDRMNQPIGAGVIPDGSESRRKSSQ